MQIAPEMGVGGIPHVVWTLCKTIDHARFDLSVLCINEGGAAAEEIRAMGIPVIELGHARHAARYFAFWRIARVLRERGVDVVHTHNTQAMVDGTLAARLAGVRRVVHSDHARLFPDKRRYMFAEHVMSHLVAKVVGVSDHTSRCLIEYEKIAPAKIVTIPNGILGDVYGRPVDRAAKRRELGLGDSQIVLGIGARLVEQKAHADLLEAVSILRQRFPDVMLLVAGEGPLEQEIRTRIDELGLGANVRMLGVRLDMADLLKTFDVYVLPSIWEGLPMAVLEAMAAGCPIVASDVGGVPTAIEHGVNGSLVPPRNPALLASAIEQLLTEPERRARYIRRGQELFNEKFSAESMTRSYERLYVPA